MVRSYENILEEMIERAPSDIDVRQGSIYYNHIAPVAFMISRYYSELEITIDLIKIDTAEGIYLEEKAKEHAIYRINASPCVRSGVFFGALLKENLRFFAEDTYFRLIYDQEGNLVLESETLGEKPNNIQTGTTLVPVNTIDGLSSASLGKIIELGTEAESDENLRRRLREKIAGPAENGNAQHYKSWCESVNGVGLARIEPLWNGNNSVRAIILGANGLGAVSNIIEDVQVYVDPGSRGLGEGVANIGAFFTALTAQDTVINISFKVQILSGTNIDIIKENCQKKLIAFFKDVSFSSANNSDMVIRSAAISNVIYETEGVIDYSNLIINNGTTNVIIPFTNAPRLGVLSIEQI